MGNGERSGSGGRRNWLVDVAGAVGGCAGVALGMLVLTLADLHEFWPWTIACSAGAGVGAVLGRLAGSRVFRRPPDIGPRA
jgi:hypothetical protein